MRQVDFFRVISDLTYAKVSGNTLRQRCDLKLSAQLISAYREGVNPNHPRGEALVKLWLEVTGKSADEVPTKEYKLPVRVHFRSMKKQRG